jgi:hypothetical protein
VRKSPGFYANFEIEGMAARSPDLRRMILAARQENGPCAADPGPLLSEHCHRRKAIAFRAEID